MAKRGSRKQRPEEDSSLEHMSVHDLQRELGRRASVLNRLRNRRTKLMDSLQNVDRQIAGLGGVRGGGGEGGRVRAHNATNLVEALDKVLTGTTMSVTDIAEEVQRQGYVTTSPNFRTIVNQTLINSGKFKRMGRGQYTSKG